MTDLIYRKQALKEISVRHKEAVEWLLETTNNEIKARAEAVVALLTECYITILKLPSAESEIIRCKDCKWWGYDDDNEVVRVCHAAKHGHMSRNWSIMIYRTHKGDFYCADAERKNDD